MNLENLMDAVLFTVYGFEVHLSNLLLALLMTVSIIVLQQVVLRRVVPHLLRSQEIADADLKKMRRRFNLTLLVLLLLGFWYSTGIDFALDPFTDVDLAPEAEGNEESGSRPYINLSITSILASVFIWQFAKLVLLVVDTISLEQYLVGKDRDFSKRPIPEKVRKEEQTRARRNFGYFINTLAVLLIISILDIDFRLINFHYADHDFVIRVSNIISAVLIFLMSRLIIWVVVRIFLRRVYARQKIDSGSQFAITQLFQYVVYFIALLLILNVMGMNPTLLAGSAAALLLGIGLGLQQTFNDFFSGILLLFERSVEVGDVVEVGGLVGTVRRIGLRTSQVQTLDNLTVIVPNSKLVTNTVTNWSHTDYLARFSVKIGVAYGSNTEEVKNLLLQVAKDHDKVLHFPSPFVRFIDFGDSALSFELFFWSSELVPIENVKSDLRFAIDQIFRDNQIEIPFPQRDVWIKDPKK